MNVPIVFDDLEHYSNYPLNEGMKKERLITGVYIAYPESYDIYILEHGYILFINFTAGIGFMYNGKNIVMSNTLDNSYKIIYNIRRNCKVNKVYIDESTKFSVINESDTMRIVRIREPINETLNIYSIGPNDIYNIRIDELDKMPLTTDNVDIKIDRINRRVMIIQPDKFIGHSTIIYMRWPNIQIINN